MKIILFLVVAVVLVKCSQAQDLYETLSRLAQEHTLGLLEDIDYDQYCGDECCNSEDALDAVAKYHTLIDSGIPPDESGACFFNGTLYDEVMGDSMVVMSNYVQLLMSPPMPLKLIYQGAIGGCLIQNYHSPQAMPFPGGARVLTTSFTTYNSVERRSQYILDKDCKLRSITNNWDSCYVGCAGMVNHCPVAYPYPAQNRSQPEIDNLYDGYMCFHVDGPPVDGEAFEDLGLCDDACDLTENNEFIVCHSPPGNPDDVQRITVESATDLQTHLAHGDVRPGEMSASGVQLDCDCESTIQDAGPNGFSGAEVDSGPPDRNAHELQI